ncbi:hypothetical protein VTO42DRAFT_4275 [Malbranchea cinnamomea]
MTTGRHWAAQQVQAKLRSEAKTPLSFSTLRETPAAERAVEIIAERVRDDGDDDDDDHVRLAGEKAAELPANQILGTPLFHFWMKTSSVNPPYSWHSRGQMDGWMAAAAVDEASRRESTPLVIRRSPVFVDTCVLLPQTLVNARRARHLVRRD